MWLSSHKSRMNGRIYSSLNDTNSMKVINIRQKSEYACGIVNSPLFSWRLIHEFGKLQQDQDIDQLEYRQFRVTQDEVKTIEGSEL